VAAMAQTYVDSEKAISGGGEEDKTQMLAEEQQRKAARLAEKALNAQMGHFTEQLKLLTNTLDLAARRSFDWMESHEGKIAASASAGRWLTEVWPSIVTFIAASTSDASEETINANVNLKKQEMDMANEELDEILANPDEYSNLQKIRAENTVINKTRAYNTALEDQEDFNTDAAIDLANEKKVANRTVATQLITDQMSDAVITDERYDTKAEVNSKIAELEQLLKDAKKDKSENLRYVRDFFSGGSLESSEEARDASTAQITAINKLISKFEAVLKALE
jgi:hypothetical protein